jgi:hypothetical protein
MNTKTPPAPPRPHLPHPVSLVYTIYRHGVRVSEPEAAQRAQDAARRLTTPE